MADVALLPSLGAGEKFALSMVSSGGAVNQPQLTLEPYHTPKRVTYVSQWLTAFNTFVSIYSVKCSQDALACVASVSVWFRRKEIPRKGVFDHRGQRSIDRARNETRAKELFYLRHFSRGL